MKNEAPQDIAQALKEQQKFIPPAPLNRKVVDLNLQKGDIVAVQRNNGTISMAILEQAPPPIGKKSGGNTKARGKGSQKPKGKGKDEAKAVEDALLTQLKVKIFDNVAPKEKNYFKQTQQEEKIMIHSILGKAKMMKTSVGSTYFLSQEERLKVLGEEAPPPPPSKKKDTSTSQPPKGKKKKKLETEIESDENVGYNFYKLSQSQNVMKIQARIEKKWERANEAARRALERQKAKQLQKKQRTGRNWMKKIIPNKEVPEIKENPYLPMSSGLQALRKGELKPKDEEDEKKNKKKRDSSSSAKKKNKKTVKDILEQQEQFEIPEYPADKNDIMTCNREMLHAVISNNVKRVKQIIADTQHVSTIYQAYSVAQDNLNPFWIAVDMHHIQIYEIFLKQIQKYQQGKGKGRCILPPSDLQQQSTGNINPMAYNTYVRRVAVARGSKQGNNAFTHDQGIRNKQFVLSFAELLKHNPTKQMVEMYANILRNGQLPWDDYSVIVEAIRQGNVELSCSLIQEASKDYNYGFVPAHTHAFTKEISNYRLPTTVIKSPGTNYGVTPLHCAAIIPDITMLKRFFQFSNGNDVTDEKGWTLAHYAAASKSSDPLNFLIKNNFPLNSPENEEGLTPLMIASKLGRYDNVVVLLKAYKTKQDNLQKRQEALEKSKQKKEQEQKKEEEEKEKNAKKKKSPPKKKGSLKIPQQEKEEEKVQNQEKEDTPPQVQQQNLQDMIIERQYHLTQDLKGLTALHHAAKSGQAQIVFYLLQQAANPTLYVNMTDRSKVTPLIYASMNGHYEIAKLLLSNNADAIKADRHGRHPLILASMNGHIHICSLLLRHGVHPDLPDSSNNTAIHYACAYGWKQLIKFFIDNKADPNVKNSWAVSPGLISLMKRNYSCLRFIIRQENVDGNLLDKQNRSLASQLCMKFDFGIRQQIEFLIEHCQIEMKTVDQAGWTVLHHLANNDPNRIAHEKIQKEQQMENLKGNLGNRTADGTITTNRYQTQAPVSNYAKKRMARMNRYNRYNNNNDNYGNFNTYYNQQNYYVNFQEIEDEKTRAQEMKRIAKFKTTRRQVEQEMILCAKLFVEHGVYPDDEEKTQNTLIYLALSNNCKFFVVWLIENGATLKFPQANVNAFGLGAQGGNIFGAVAVVPEQQEKEKPKNNLLHLLSNKLSYQSQSMIYRALLARNQLETLKQFARERQNPGITPLESYFMNLYQMLCSNQTTKRVFNMIKRIKDIAALYVKEFEIDILATMKPFNPIIKQKNDQTIQQQAGGGVFGGGLFGGGGGAFGGGIFGGGGLFNNNNNNNMNQLPYNQNILGLFQVNDIQNVEGTQRVQDDQEFSDISSQSQIDEDEQVMKKTATAIKRPAKKATRRMNRNNYSMGYYGGGSNNNDLFQMDNRVQKYRFTDCNLLHLLLYPKFASQYEEKYIDLINFILFELNEKGPQKFETKSYSGLTPFAMLRKHFDEKLFDIILKAKHSIHFVEDGTEFQMIHYIVFKRSKRLVTKLIKYQPESINAKDALGNTPLHYACQYRHSSLVAFLIQQGADLSILNKSERTPLHIAIHAISEGHGSDRDLKIEEYLTTNQDGQKLINSQDKLKRTPFHYLFVKLTNQENNSSFDPIDVTSTILRNCSSVIDVNIQDNKGNTVLHYACKRGATISMLSILKEKAEIQTKNQVGNTAFAVALLAQKVDLGAFLINQGCEPNTLIWRKEKREEVAKKQSLPLFKANTQSITLNKVDQQYYSGLKLAKVTKTVAPQQGNLFPSRKYAGRKKVRRYNQYNEEDDDQENSNNLQNDAMKSKAETTLYYAIQNNMQGLVHMLSREAFSKFQILAQSLKAESLNLFKRMLNNSTKKQIQEREQSGRNLYSMLAWNKNSSDWTNFSQHAHRLLRRNGLSPFQPDNNNRTALYYACKRLKHKLVSKLLKMAGDDGTKLLNTKETKNGLNSITTIIKSIKHSIISKKPNKFNSAQEREQDASDEEDDGNNFGIFRYNYGNQNNSTKLMQFDSSSQVMLLKKINRKFQGILHDIDLQFEEGGEESSNFIINYSRLFKRIEMKMTDFCYYYQYIFDKMLNPQLWAERAGVKPKYVSHATIFAAKMNNYKLLHFLLNNCKLAADEVDSNKRSALTWGVLHNNKDIVELVLQKLDKGKKKEALQSQYELISLPEKESGKTSLHWAIKSIPVGSFANQKILSRFVDIAVKTNNFDTLFNLQDQDGFTPISLARKNIYLFGLIQELSGKDIGEPEMFQPRKLDPKFIDSPLEDKKFDVSQDANQYIDKKEAQRKKEKQERREKLREAYIKQAEEKGEEFNEQDFEDELNDNVVAVNKYALQGEGGNFKVMRDQDINQCFDVFGIKIDVNKYCNGQAVFYEMQILYEKNKKFYMLFTRWGRLGDTYGGQFQKTPFSTLVEAKAEWCKVFKQKFAVGWETQQYYPIPGKYRIKIIGGRRIIDGAPEDDEAREIRFSRRQFSINALVKPFKSQKLPQPKFQNELIQFIQPIVSALLMNSGFNQFQVHDEFFLLALLDPTVIEKAKEILKKIEKQIKKLTKSMKNAQIFTTQGILQQLTELSNEYYDIVPPLDAANSALQPIKNQHQVQNHMNKLTSIYDISITTKLMLGARLLKYEINPYDYLLHNLNVKIQPLQCDGEDPIYDSLMLYINNGLTRMNYNTSVVNIFEVDQEGVKKRQYESQDLQVKSEEIFNQTHNHFLLWHGTGPQNLISILERGLMIAGHNSARSGNLFGDGVYFADSIEKSINYAPFQNNSSYLLLCEVALGNVLNTENIHQFKEPPFGYHSIRYAGSVGPDFKFNVVNDQGITIPLGPTIHYPKKVCLYDGKIFKNDQDLNYYIRHGKRKPKQAELNVFEPKRDEQQQEEEQQEQEEADQPIQENEDDDEDDKDEDEEEQEKQVIKPKASSKKSSPSKKKPSSKKTPPKKKTPEEIRKEFLNPGKRVKRFEPNVIPKRDKSQYFNFYSYGDTSSEYIVYNPSQIKVKYIVQLRQNVNSFGF